MLKAILPHPRAKQVRTCHSLLFALLFTLLLTIPGWIYLQRTQHVSAAPLPLDPWQTEAVIRVPNNQFRNILVQFTQDTTLAARDALIATLGGQLVRWLAPLHVAEIRLPVVNSKANNNTVMAASSLEALIEADSFVQYAEYDMPVEGVSTEITGTANDPGLAIVDQSYGLQKIHAIEAWKIMTGSSEIVIAVLDTGVNAAHPEFVGRLVQGRDIVNNDDDPTDDHGHGTHTAGIIGANLNNNSGVAGVCPGCKLMAIKVLDQNNAGSWSGVAEGIIYAADHGARVINMSLGASSANQTVEQAVVYAQAQGVLIIAAAGNMGNNQPFYPASFAGVIGVGATEKNDERWVFSNIGSYIDVAAPGYSIFSPHFNLDNEYKGYSFVSGTSMAAPFVSGLAGLLLSQKPSRTALEVTHLITETADALVTPGWDETFGQGRINAQAALAKEALQSNDQPTPTPPSPPVENPLPAASPTPLTNSLANSKDKLARLYLPVVIK